MNIAVSTGEYVLTGVDNTITKGLHLAVEVGSYILTGISVNLLRPIRNMIVSVGKFILTGIDALFHGRGAWTWDNQSKHSVDWTNQNKSK